MGSALRVGTSSVLGSAILCIAFLLFFNAFTPTNMPPFERSEYLLLAVANLGLAFAYTHSKIIPDWPMYNRKWDCYVFFVFIAVVGSFAFLGGEYASIAVLYNLLVLIGQILAIRHIEFNQNLAGGQLRSVQSGIHIGAEDLISLLPPSSSDVVNTQKPSPQTCIKEIVLRGEKIASIDLSPLSSFTNLKVLDLSQNRLTQVDLSPISFCTSLEKLILWLNRLETLDLSPLAFCTHLRELNLMDNNLTQIDLTPLRSCKEFEYLDLSGNRISEIDFWPLSASVKFNALNVEVEMEELDLTPLSSSRQLKTLTISGRGLKRLDLTPLGTCSELDFLMVDSTESLRLDITPLFSCSKLTNLQVCGIELIAAALMEHRDWPEGLNKHRNSVQFY